MQYQNDYILRLIEQMGALLRQATQRLREGDEALAHEIATTVVGEALDMEPATVRRLSPQSLSSLVEMNNLDERVIALLADALDLEADAEQASGALVEASQRREQARAVRHLLSAEHAN